MKKIIFASAAALCAAVSLSSFKAVHKSFTTTYYFKVTTGSGGNTTFANADLILNYGVTPPTSNPCNAGTADKCVIGFTAAQLTAVNHAILLTSGFGITAATPSVTQFKRTAA